MIKNEKVILTGDVYILCIHLPVKVSASGY